MHLLCPHCHNPIELVDLARQREVVCTSCGSSFQLAPGSTTGWRPADGRRRLGRFELLGELGQGAFGTVYKARDPDLDRVVALKVPRAGNLAGGEDLDRFLREARSVAQLRHPGIVPVHEAGQHDGVPYLVSDFVAGVTLADLLETRRPAPCEAASLTAAVADALHYAHAHAVVHRDVKPSNIMLGDDGTPYLMDFGLAKREAGEITMTLEGQVLGTPAYMSPEQARGEAHRVDGRSDVYSLGVILYRLLTGELPFRGNTRMLLHQVLHDEPKPPRALNDKVPRDLETVCLKALAKEPAHRYATAGDLAEDLRRFLKGEPIVARPVSSAERLWRWCRRNPAVAGLVATVAGLLLAVAAGATWAAVRAADQAQTERDLRLAAQRAEGVALHERNQADDARRRAADAEHEAYRTVLERNHIAADSFLKSAEMLRYAGGRTGVREEALALLARAAALRPSSARALAALGEAAGDLPATERVAWEARRLGLRDEATHWLRHRDLGRVRDVVLPLRAGRYELPPIAVSPDGARFAVAYEREVVLHGPDGRAERTLPVPVRQNSGDQPMALRFDAPDRLEYHTREEVITWTLADDKPHRRQRAPQDLDTGRSGWPSPRMPAELRSARFGASGNIHEVSVWPADAPARARAVWRSAQLESAQFPLEQLRTFHFGDQPSWLFMLTDRRLFFIDLGSGLRAEASLEDLPRGVKEAQAVAGGVVTLAFVQAGLVNRQGAVPRSARVTFWRPSAAPAGEAALTPDGPVRCLDRAADGRLLVGTGQLVQGWQGRQRAWSWGQAAHRIAASVTWWDFDDGQPGALVAWREPEARPDGGIDPYSVRAEVYASADGRLLHTCAITGPRRVLLPPYPPPALVNRFVPVVTGTNATDSTLDLWSLAENRSLGRLGTFPRNVAPDLTLSPGGDWLLVRLHGTAELGIWRLRPQVRLVARVPNVPAAWHAVFDRDERRVALVAPSYLPAQPSEQSPVLDLESGRRLGQVSVPPQASVSFAAHDLICLRGEPGPPTKQPTFRCSACDWSTGRQTELGTTVWGLSSPAVYLSPDGQRLLLSGWLPVGTPDRRGQQAHQFHLELWHLPEKKQLLTHSVDGPRPPDSRTARFRPWSWGVATDHEQFYLVAETPGLGMWGVPVEGDPLPAATGWRWADGAKAPDTTRRFLTRAADGSVALWRDGKGLLLYDDASGTYSPLQGGEALRASAVSFALTPPAARVPGGVVLQWLPLNRPGVTARRLGLWQANTGKPLGLLPEAQRHAVFDRSGRWLLSADESQQDVMVWEAATGRLTQRLRVPVTDPPPPGPFGRLPFAPRLSGDGTRLGLVTDGVLRLWDLPGQRPLLVLDRTRHYTPVNAVAQHAGANLVASGAGESVVVLRDRRDGHYLRSLFGHAGPVTALAFHPDGTRLASASEDGTVILWQADGSRVWSRALAQPGRAVRGLAFHPKGALLAAGAGAGRIVLLDCRDGRTRATGRTGEAAVQALTFSRDGVLLASGDGAGGVRLWDGETLTPRQSWATDAAVTAVQFVGPNATWLATGGRSVQIHETATGRRVWTLEVPKPPVRALALDAGRGELAVADEGDQLQLLDLADLSRQLRAWDLDVSGLLSAFPAGPRGGG